jgi:hypothetical protein
LEDLFDLYDYDGAEAPDGMGLAAEGNEDGSGGPDSRGGYPPLVEAADDEDDDDDDDDDDDGK